MTLHAHLLALSAENAAHLSDASGTQRYLDESEALLQYLPEHHDEFDRASWHGYAGVCALILKRYDVATEEFEAAMSLFPPESILHHVLIFIPFTIAYAHLRDRDQCLIIAKKASLSIKLLGASSMKKQFMDYIQQEIISSFPNDKQVRDFARDTYQLLMGAPETNTNT